MLGRQSTVPGPGGGLGRPPISHIAIRALIDGGKWTKSPTQLQRFRIPRSLGQAGWLRGQPSLLSAMVLRCYMAAYLFTAVGCGGQTDVVNGGDSGSDTGSVREASAAKDSAVVEGAPGCPLTGVYNGYLQGFKFPDGSDALCNDPRLHRQHHYRSRALW